MDRLRAARLVLLALWPIVAIRCVPAGPLPAATPELATETPFAQPIAQETATALPQVQPWVMLVSGRAPAELEESLRLWAGERSWGLELASPPEFSQALARPGLMAIVSFRSELGPAAWTELPSDLVALAIEEPGLQPSSTLSTISASQARWDQAGFLAGTLVGLASRTWSTALVTGGESEQELILRNAFAHGLRYACARCRLSEINPQNVNVTAMRERGVDAVFVMPGPGAQDAIESMAGAFRIVWVGWLPEWLTGDQLAARVAFAPQALLDAAMQGLAQGEPGQALAYSIESGSLRLADLDGQAITPGRLRLVEAAMALIAAGELDPGIDPQTGAER